VVIGDPQVGREKGIVNWWDAIFYKFAGVPTDQLVVGKGIEKRLEEAIRKINSMESKPDFVVIVGDLTETADQEQFNRVNEILSKLNVPYLLLLGNHDIWPYKRDTNGKVVYNAQGPIMVKEFEDLFKDSFVSFPYPTEKQDKDFQNYSFIIDDTKFVVVDNVNRKRSPFGLPGALGLSKLHSESEAWLKQQLAGSEKRVIIFSHAPLRMGLLRKLSKGQKQILAIAGHTHKRSEKILGNITRLTTNALYHEPLMLQVLVEEANTSYQYLSI
jgi:predicted MPP superfamily phosphohydrolase